MSYLKLSISMRSLEVSNGRWGRGRRAETDRCAWVDWSSPGGIRAVWAATSSSPSELRYVPTGDVGTLAMSLALNTELDRVESRWSSLLKRSRSDREVTVLVLSPNEPHTHYSVTIIITTTITDYFQWWCQGQGQKLSSRTKTLSYSEQWLTYWHISVRHSSP